MPRPQMASSFSVIMQEDSIDGIFETVKKCALISRCSGKIGLAVHNIRSTGSPIFGVSYLRIQYFSCTLCILEIKVLFVVFYRF